MATAALATADAFGFASSKKMIGIQLYSVRDEIKTGLPAVLAKLAGMGYQNIEMYGYNNGDYFGHDMKAVANLLAKNNLKSTSAHVGIADFLYKGNDDVWKKAVDDAAIIGNEYLAVPYLDAEYRKTADGYKKIADRLNTAATICKSRGLKFAYHNHAFEFEKMGTGTGYDILLKETDPALVKMELDLFWVVNAGYNPLALFNAHPGRFVMWHVKDMDKTNKNKQTEVGNGKIDFKAIFKAKKKAGLEQFFVEQENYDISPYDSVEKCIRYVKSNLI